MIVIVFHWSVKLYLYSLWFSISCTVEIVFMTAIHQHENGIRKTSPSSHVLVLQHHGRRKSAGPWSNWTKISRGRLNFVQIFFVQTTCKICLLILCLCYISKINYLGQKHCKTLFSSCKSLTVFLSSSKARVIVRLMYHASPHISRVIVRLTCHYMYHVT